MRDVVLGLGNPLMTDDGLGIVALEVLRNSWIITPDVELVDGGTWGLNLLPLLETTDRLLVLDAIHLGRHPGGLVTLERDAIPRYLTTKLSPHEVDFREVLALSELRGTMPQEIVALGLEPDRIAPGTELSDRVQMGVRSLVWLAVQRLRAWGHACRPVPVAACTS